jgi:hypothetical protein
VASGPEREQRVLDTSTAVFTEPWDDDHLITIAYDLHTGQRYVSISNCGSFTPTKPARSSAACWGD